MCVFRVRVTPGRFRRRLFSALVVIPRAAAVAVVVIPGRAVTRVTSASSAVSGLGGPPGEGVTTRRPPSDWMARSAYWSYPRFALSRFKYPTG